jgi:two-component system NtrC family sensor kinase
VEGEIRIATWEDQQRVYIQISDTGRGIPPENLHQIFNPGFTTKGVGVGTGLGLSISYNIVQKHRGDLQAESEVGAGTTFTLVLPMNLSEAALES